MGQSHLMGNLSQMEEAMAVQGVLVDICQWTAQWF